MTALNQQNSQKEPSQQTPEQNPSLYWGFWATLLLGFLIFLSFSIIQGLGLFAYILATDANAMIAASNPDATADFQALMNAHLFNGDAIAIAEIPAAIIGILLVIWFTSMRKAVGIEAYLELYAPKLKSILVFLGLMVLAIILMEVLNLWLDRPTPEFMTKVYANTRNLPLLWLAVGVAAPFFEEFLFRGFLLEGFARSPIGVVGAILLTSAIWALIHMQYAWFEIIAIFFIGILLSVAKIKSRSLYVPIAMHMLMNILASIGMQLSQ